MVILHSFPKFYLCLLGVFFSPYPCIELTILKSIKCLAYPKSSASLIKDLLLAISQKAIRTIHRVPAALLAKVI